MRIHFYFSTWTKQISQSWFWYLQFNTLPRLTHLTFVWDVCNRFSVFSGQFCQYISFSYFSLCLSARVCVYGRRHCCYCRHCCCWWWRRAECWSQVSTLTTTNNQSSKCCLGRQGGVGYLRWPWQESRENTALKISRFNSAFRSFDSWEKETRELRKQFDATKQNQGIN